MPNSLTNCPDCAVAPGKCHEDGCDVERCSVCGLQRFGCGCEGHDKNFARWKGIWPGSAESEYLGIDLNTFYIQKLHLIFFVKQESAEMKSLIAKYGWYRVLLYGSMVLASIASITLCSVSAYSWYLLLR